MRYLSFLIFLTFLMLLSACGERTIGAPTPFPTTAPQSTALGNAPVSLTVTELMAAPGLYRDAVVQLTGRLRKQPLVVCESEMHPSPAGWGLAEEGVLALAGGYEQQVRTLLPDDLTMSVEGRWRLWEGLVGCGKQAAQQEIWYLEVGRILSPSPITQVTLTPGGEIAISAITNTPTIEGVEGIESEAFPSPNPQETPLAPEATEDTGGYPGTVEETPSEGDLTPTSQATAATPDAAITPLTTPDTAATPTLTGTAGTPVATSSTSGTPTATPSGTPPTPTPTATGGAPGQVTDKGNLYEQLYETEGEFLTSNLAAGAVDSWQLDIFEGESAFVYVVAPTPADLVVSLLQDGQPIVNRQNNAPAGSPEFINNPNIPGEGTYEIQVSTVGGEATDYAITAHEDEESFRIIQGILVSGVPRVAIQLPEFATHFWFFVGSAGDVVTIDLTPLGQEDAAMYLFGPDGEEVEVENQTGDDGFEGEAERLELTLPSDGLFALAIIEAYSDPMGYDLELTTE